MQPVDNQQSFLPLYDQKQARSRPEAGISASIWAPQPLPSDSSWPKAMDSFVRLGDRDRDIQFQQNFAEARVPLVGPTREDVFGPDKRQIGAIGDGRRRSSPGIDSAHVEQLLRTLNLNSPAPTAERPSLNLSFDGNVNVSTSPDFSPASVASALLTPTDMSPARTSFADTKVHTGYEFPPLPYLTQQQALFEPTTPTRNFDDLTSSHSPTYRATHLPSSYSSSPNNAYSFYESYSQQSPSGALSSQGLMTTPSPQRRLENARAPPFDWHAAQPLSSVQAYPTSSDWIRPEEKQLPDFASASMPRQESLRSSFAFKSAAPQGAHEPINFLSLLHPSSSPPYLVFVNRIIKSSDQQASIFLQQKLKVADSEERAKIVDAICTRGYEMMAHRFGNWAVQRCLEAASSPDERRKIVACMRGRVVELATNCYGCHVLQKALDCEEDIRLLIVSELLLHDPASTLVNKHASHVWSKIMELTWTHPAPPIFAYVNKSLQGKWAALACHETGSLVVQHAFENLEDSAKDGIVDELLNQGSSVFSEVVKNQWGAYCIQHILEHGSDNHRQMTLDHLINGLLEFSTNEQGAKSVTKALKEGGKDTVDKFIKRMCEPAKGARRAMIVDLALSVTGSQLIANVLPTADKEQRAALYDCIRGHIVTLRGCKTGSKVIWLFDRMVRLSLALSVVIANLPIARILWLLKASWSSPP
ncbi:hypothetical protein EYR40_003290 [Pleurotus pulmonarius]|nr:hypothetical protein EYR40_003290 [Pleurotus pulmonarius]KAF4606018.1 hypothetical protein EYR38_000063 [Pleurotus pulmonarius]